MKKIGYFYITFPIFIIVVILLNYSSILAQRASAEFIASIGPTRLVTGQEVKDGIKNITYYDDNIYVVNVWAGIQVLNVSDRTNPKEIGKYQNEHRAHNFYIDGTYGYLSDELGGVHILDISNPSAIIRTGKIETEGQAFWVVADYPYVYVAEEESGVSVYDITNTASPVLLGKYDTPGWAWELILRDNILFVSDKSGGLQIIDVTDKQNLKRLGQLSGPKNARSISLGGNYIYLANGAECMCVIDVTNPKFPALVTKMPVDGYIADVFHSGKNLFMANETKHTIEIVDVSTLPEIRPGGSYQAEDKIFGIWKEDVYVFVAANKSTLILRYNSPPKLAAIEDVISNEQDLITVTVEAFDPDGDILHFEVDNKPEGAAFDSTSGTLTWTPSYEQSGVYSGVTIRVIEYTDSRLTDEKDFTITVNHVNRSPTLPEVDDAQVNENEVLTINVEEGSDEDVEDTGKLLYSVENMPQGATFDATKRIFTWQPTYEQSGTYILDFVLSDQAGGFDRDASTITVIHVDRKPNIVKLENKTVDENKELTFIVEGSDPDKEDQNAISFNAIGLPEGAVFSTSDRRFSWTPSYEQSGVYENLIFIMQAGNLSDSTTMSITVNHVNRPPVMADLSGKTVDENKRLTFNVSGTDPDREDEGKLVFSATNLPEGAKFNPDSMMFSWVPTYEQSGNFDNITFTITDPAGAQDSKTIPVTVNHVNRPPVLIEIPPQTIDENVPLTFNLQGSDPDKEDQNNLIYSAKQLPEGATLEGTAFSWTPTYAQSGEYTVEYTLSDGNLSDTKTAVITINHVNRPPTIEPIDPQVVDENKTLQFKVIGGDPDTEDTDKWTLSTSQLPEGAVFTAETATFSWTPTFDQSGNYTITITNTDEQGLSTTQEVQITVNHINRTPVFNPITAQMIDENNQLNITIPAGEDPDVEDTQKLAYSVQNLPEGASFDPATRTLTWTPSYEQSGSYEIPVSLTDGEFTVTQTLAVTVNHINRPPALADIADQATDENEPFTFTAQISDPDKEDEGKLQASASNMPEGMTFNATTGELAWTPNYDQAGTYTNISLSVSDPGGLSIEKSFNFTVNNVNRPPELAQILDQTSAENAPLSITFQGTDPDKEDEGKLQYSAENLPIGAAIDQTTGILNWTPNFTQAGSYQLKVKVTDTGGLSSEMSFAADITDVNRPPQIQPVDAMKVDEGGALSFSLAASDEDTDNEHRFSIDNLPDGATLDATSGSFSWTPEYDQAGTYSLNAKVSDGTAESSTTISITVNDVNRPPEVEEGGSVTVTVGETARLNFSASDPDGDNLTFESSDLPAGASLNASSGEFIWSPSEDQTGNFTFTVKVSDGKDSAEATGSVTVNPKPEPAVETPPPPQ